MVTPEIYCDIFDCLERAGVRYVVIGGVAVVLRGHVRPIVDLDMIIDPAPDAADYALRTLYLSGFVPSVPLPLGMLSVLRLFDHKQREVDVFVRDHIPFNDLWADSEQMRVGNSVVRVESLAHLLQAKRITARPHDLSDIAGLLALGVDSGAR